MHCHQQLVLRPQGVVPKHLDYQGHMGEIKLLRSNVGDYDSVGMRWDLGCSTLKKLLSSVLYMTLAWRINEYIRLLNYNLK